MRLFLAHPAVRHQQALGALDQLALVERGAHGLELVAHGLQPARLGLHHVEHRALERAAIERGGLGRGGARGGRHRRQHVVEEALAVVARRQGVEQAPVVLELAPRLFGLVAALQPQVIGQLVLDGAHGVDARAAAVEPGLAQPRVGQAARGRRARMHGADAAHALEPGQGAVALALAPQREQRGIRELGEDLEAALLRLDQVQPLGPLRVVDAARGEGGGAEGALLARELLALHEVEQRHQQARDLGVGGAVGGLEHHRQQPRDQLGEGRGGLRGLQFERADAPAQGRQAVQARQHPGDAAEQTRVVAVARAAVRLGLEPVEAQPHRLLECHALGDLRIALVAEARAARGQEQVRHAALALQRMHEPADGTDQLAGARELLECVDLAAPRGDQEVQSGFHGVPEPQQHPCRTPAPAAPIARRLHSRPCCF